MGCCFYVANVLISNSLQRSLVQHQENIKGHLCNKNPFKKGSDRSKEEIGCVVEMDLKNKESKTIICVLMVFY